MSEKSNGFSGADCAALLREAGLAVLKEDMEKPKGDDNNDATPSNSLCIQARHFDYAFKHVLPSVSRKDQARYDRIRQRMARARTRGTGAEETPSEAVSENAAAEGGGDNTPLAMSS